MHYAGLVAVTRRLWKSPYHRCPCGNHWHDDVIKWKHFPRYWPFVRGIHRSPVNSPHKGQWHGALMFSLICVWIYGWVNNREAGDLRRYRAHYDVIVIILWGRSKFGLCNPMTSCAEGSQGGPLIFPAYSRLVPIIWPFFFSVEAKDCNVRPI